MSKTSSIKYWSERLKFLAGSGGLTRELAARLSRKKTAGAAKKLPLRSIGEITGGVEPVLAETESRDGNVTFEELKCICAIVKKFSPADIFEIGTFDGRTTLNMAMNAPGARITTLDLPAKDMAKTRLRIKSGEKKFINKEVSGTRFLGTAYAQRITQVYADSAAYHYRDNMDSTDLVFIDGSHSYEYVVSDTLVAFRLLRKGRGIILWHDYGWQEVILALNEFYDGDERCRGMVNIEGTSLVMLELR